MLDYDFKFKKGILFIRLKGDVIKKTSKLLDEKIDPLVLENGISNVVFNVSKLNTIDKYGLLAFYKTYLKLNKKSDISLCEIPKFLRKKFKFLLKHIKEREDEYTILTKS